MISHRGLQRLFLRLPRTWRQGIAERMRQQSRELTAEKAMTITDVSAATVVDAFMHAGVDRIIHGHTHRPETHRLTVNGRDCERIVLPDWTSTRMEGLRIDANDHLSPTPA